MSFASFDRRLRRIESTVGSDDPRRFLHLPAREWPTAVIERVLAMTEAERAALLDETGARSIAFADLPLANPAVMTAPWSQDLRKRLVRAEGSARELNAPNSQPPRLRRSSAWRRRSSPRSFFNGAE